MRKYDKIHKILLQLVEVTYFDNEASGVLPARHRLGRTLKTLAQMLKGKEGRRVMDEKKQELILEQLTPVFIIEKKTFKNHYPKKDKL